MSYNSNTSAAATANQALMVLLDTLNEVVEQVLCSQSKEDKMRLSRNIAFQLNNAVCSHLTLATYIPLHLLSMAAEVHHAQRGTAHLVQVLDWSQVGHNEDICRGHPLYSKTLGPLPTVTIPASSSSAPAPAGPSSAPVPAGPSIASAPAGSSSAPTPAGPSSAPAPAGPSSAPAPAGPSSVPDPAGPSTLTLAGPTSSPAPAQTLVPPIATLLGPSIVIKIPGGAVPGPSKHRKQQFSVSPPRLVKRARKIVKSKQILSDTDTNSDGVRVDKGHDQAKGKGKARVRSPSLMTGATPALEVKPRQLTQHVLKKVRSLPVRPLNARDMGAEAAEYEPEEDVESIGNKRKPHHDQVTDMKLSMSGVRHLGTDKDKKGKRPQLVRHPAIAIRTDHTHTHPSQQPIDTWKPSPILEEPDADVEMLDDAPTMSSTTPVPSDDDFPENHWIEPMDDSILPPTPFEETPDEVRYTPVYLACAQRPPSPATTSMPIQSHQPPRHLTNAEIEATLAQIQIDMQELCIHDDTIHNDLSHCIDKLHANYLEQFGLQKGLVDQLTFQVGGMVRYLRDHQRASASSVTTPPAFDPPPIVIPGTPIFPKFGSISALGRAVTNNIFTPDVFSTGAGPAGDGSRVTRHEQAPTSSSTSTINPAPTSVPIQPVVALPVPTHTESMPSTSTIRMMVTGSPNVPEDGQSVSAPLPQRLFVPQSCRQGRLVSARHVKNSSGDGPK
ncbi:hypothetical protein BDR05DRAFT_1003502 [Suillus weaverae]|nr:hypothetical protein BDR05DRAFT_1003502 [Suillus weaverae]